jgi:hypothetical protein
MPIFPGSNDEYSRVGGFYLPVDPNPKPATKPEAERIKVECPMCKGKGETAEAVYERVYDPIATGMLGQFAQPQYTPTIVGYTPKKCELCYGRKWVSAKPVP